MSHIFFSTDISAQNVEQTTRDIQQTIQNFPFDNAFLHKTSIGPTEQDSILALHLYKTHPKHENEHIHELDDWSLVLDGRLTNKSDIVEELPSGFLNDKAEGGSDGMVILLALLHWDKDAIRKLEGEFACIACHRSGRVLAFRDHIGTRPLFCMSNAHSNTLVISSDLTYFASNHQLTVDKQLLEATLCGTAGVIFKSPWNEVESIPPAHILEWEIGKEPKLSQYWSLEKHHFSHLKTDTDWLNAIAQQHELAVHESTLSTTPITFQLSEGLDSGSIISLGASQVEQAFSVSHRSIPPAHPDALKYWQKTYQELDDIRAPFPHIQPLWNEESIDFTKASEQISTQLKVPFAIATEFLGHHLLASKNGSRVMLSGWGGDQALSYPGYALFSELILQLKFVKLWRHATKPNDTLPKKFLSYLRALKTGTIYFLFSKNIGNKKPYPSLIKNQKLPYRFKAETSVSEHIRLNINTDGVDYRIVMEQITGMQTGIETRFPLLNRKLLELVASCPSHLFYDHGLNRLVMRSILKDKYPNYLRVRLKGDVNIPFHEHKKQMDKLYEENLKRIEPLKKQKEFTDIIDFSRMPNKLGENRSWLKISKELAHWARIFDR
ncbi:MULTISPECIES: asparagine synthase-related protein [Gammaproteobacteria]|uniref:asparagine synthase-related protein n=1 Tax=Gammaproteobacteria TaxID=1236 RepID=UPI000DD04B64|nr:MULTISPECIES: asparagine synthase-related protein [Gammaproteobacteria]RTE86090.1 hypothetical protein DQX04_05830 [Aliidiomarina sp. B3213]TCZ91444.1 hypothetical protein EYQ95_05840 [Lysobacter sp. N42]